MEYVRVQSKGGRPMARGDKVLVRGYLGEPGVGRVWEISERVVYVCTETMFERWERTGTEPIAGGYQFCDTFEFDPEILRNIKQEFATAPQQGVRSWSIAKLYWG